MRIGYLASHYPAVSHRFLLREVQALRRCGVEVETFSIHRPPASEMLAGSDREEGAGPMLCGPRGHSTCFVPTLAPR